MSSIIRKYKPRGSQSLKHKSKAGKAAAAKRGPEGNEALATSGGYAALRKYGREFYRQIQLRRWRMEKKAVGAK